MPGSDPDWFSKSIVDDKTVLAEGIETTAQLDALKLAGCDIGQGYHLGRPMEASAIVALLNAGVARSA